MFNDQLVLGIVGDPEVDDVDLSREPKVSNNAVLVATCGKRAASADVIQCRDLQALLNMEHIDTVLIGESDANRLDQAAQAIEAGKDVVVVLPILTSIADRIRFETLVMNAENRGVRVSAYHRRYDPPIEWVRNSLREDGRHRHLPTLLGRLYGVTTHFHWLDPIDTRGPDIFALREMIHHQIDLANFCLGMSRLETWCIVNKRNRYHVQAHRADGIVVNFSGTRGMSRNPAEYCRLQFQRGEVCIDLVRGRIDITHFEGGTIETIPGPISDNERRARWCFEDLARSIGEGSPGHLRVEDLLMQAQAPVLLREGGPTLTTISGAI